MREIAAHIQLVLVLIVLCVALASGFKKFRGHPFRSNSHVNRYVVMMSSVDRDIDKTALDLDLDEVRKWYLVNFNRRPDDLKVVENSCKSIPSLVSEIWKQILVSVRVLEKDPNSIEYRSVQIFSGFDMGESDQKSAELFRTIESVVKIIEETQSSYLMQPNFKRIIACRMLPSIPKIGHTSPLLMIEFLASREVQLQPKLDEDWLEEDFTPNMNIEDQTVTNDIPEFPFATVFDFISEVNRPADIATMADLKTNYKTIDLKYDLVKMARKKDPQEVVNAINCKLTRLKKWRDVLEKSQREDLDAFTRTQEWSEAIKLKYRSLKALAKSDPKKALDTQYDKRATFINIIDQWSDRLKRNFKFIFFESNREPEDFNQAMLDSAWRNEVRNCSLLLEQAPFLDFHGPDFKPGIPAPIFDDNRVVLWESGYPVEIVVKEMLVWLEKVDKALAIADQPGYGEMEQHTYSRGLITERVAFDTWCSLSRWLGDGDSRFDNVENNETALDATSLLELLRRGAASEADDTHQKQYTAFLKQLNTLARERSSVDLTSVQELFKSSAQEGKEMVEWWTKMVRDLDKTEELAELAQSRDADTMPWSAVIKEFLEDEVNSVAREEGTAAEDNQKLWEERYARTFMLAEGIQDVLPWKKKAAQDEQALFNSLRKGGALTKETVSLSFIPSTPGNTRNFLFVAPRFFRGLGNDEELSAFIEYAKMVESHVQNAEFLKLTCIDPASQRIELVLLHKEMVTDEGVPDYARRSPHPAIIFQIKQF